MKATDLTCEEFRNRYQQFHEEIDIRTPIVWGFMLKTAVLLQHRESCRGCNVFASEWEEVIPRVKASQQRKAAEIVAQARRFMGRKKKPQKK